MRRFLISTLPQGLDEPEPFVRRLHRSESINDVLTLAVECEEFIQNALLSSQLTQHQADALYRVFDQEVDDKLYGLQRVDMLNGISPLRG